MIAILKDFNDQFYKGILISMINSTKVSVSYLDHLILSNYIFPLHQTQDAGFLIILSAVYLQISILLAMKLHGFPI